jgi:perosamine synthetase
MITTDDDALAERLKRLRWMGITRGTWERFRSQQEKPSWDYEVDEVGFKCGMNDLNAALGLIQLAKLESANGQRREIASQYAKAFGDLPWFRIPVERSYARSAYHAYAPRVDDRDGLIRHLATREIDASVYYKPNHLYSVYEPYRRPLPVTDTVWKQLVTIPLFPSMTEGEIAQVIDAVRCFQPNGQGS